MNTVKTRNIAIFLLSTLIAPIIAAPTLEITKAFETTLQEVHMSIAKEGAALFEAGILDQNKPFYTVKKHHVSPKRPNYAPGKEREITYHISRPSINHILQVAQSNESPEKITLLIPDIKAMLETINHAENPMRYDNNATPYSASERAQRILLLRAYRNNIMAGAIPFLRAFDISKIELSKKRDNLIAFFTEYLNISANRERDRQAMAHDADIFDNLNNAQTTISEAIIDALHNIDTLLNDIKYENEAIYYVNNNNNNNNERSYKRTASFDQFEQEETPAKRLHKSDPEIPKVQTEQQNLPSSTLNPSMPRLSQLLTGTYTDNTRMMLSTKLQESILESTKTELKAIAREMLNHNAVLTSDSIQTKFGAYRTEMPKDIDIDTLLTMLIMLNERISTVESYTVETAIKNQEKISKLTHYYRTILNAAIPYLKSLPLQNIDHRAKRERIINHFETALRTMTPDSRQLTQPFPSNLRRISITNNIMRALEAIHTLSTAKNTTQTNNNNNNNNSNNNNNLH